MSKSEAFTAACKRIEVLKGSFPDYVISAMMNAEINFVYVNRNKSIGGMALLYYDLNDFQNPATIEMVMLPVNIEDGPPIMLWLWQCLVAHEGAQAVFFYFESADDKLSIVFMEPDALFTASVPVSDGRRITGQWRVERHSKRSQA